MDINQLATTTLKSTCLWSPLSIKIIIRSVRIKWLNRTLITSPYCYGLCLTEKEFHKELKKLKVPLHSYPEHTKYSDGASTHYLEKGGGRVAIVCLGNTKGYTKEQVYALIAHEAVHIWQAICDELGEDTPSAEFEAYSLQQITQNLLESYREQTMKKKKNAK